MAARSFTGSLESNELQEHILHSYFIMRVGIAALGMSLPFLLLFGGMAAHICAQGSMSAYYHAVGTDATGHGSMRNWFVGILFAVSISLGLYRGYSRVEDWLLDAAGVLGIGIAVFPMEWLPWQMPGCGVAGSVEHVATKVFGYPLHAVCAISFFLCIALVCWFCADDTLHLEPSETRRRALKLAYRTIAVLMPALMFVAWGLNTVFDTTWAVFWVEAAGVLLFGVFWLLKGFELRHTAADQKAATGRLALRSGRVEEIR
jgi:hypothetical protein